MAPPLVGYCQATYVLQHAEIARPMAVTCGHSMGSTPTDPVNIANELHNAFGLNVMQSVDSNVTLTHTDILVGTTDGVGSGTVRSSVPGIAGGTSMNGLPANCAVLITKRTETLGRRGTGRMFLPFAVNEANVSEGGILDGTWVTDIQTTFDAWEADLSTPWGVLEAGLNSTDGVGTLERTFRPITAFVVQNQIATQRRRLRRQ